MAQFADGSIPAPEGSNLICDFMAKKWNYLLVNNTDFVLDVMESLSNQSNLKLMPNSITPFWPKNFLVKQKNSLKFRPIIEKQEKNNFPDIPYSASIW